MTALSQVCPVGRSVGTIAGEGLRQFSTFGRWSRQTDNEVMFTKNSCTCLGSAQERNSKLSLFGILRVTPAPHISSWSKPLTVDRGHFRRRKGLTGREYCKSDSFGTFINMSPSSFHGLALSRPRPHQISYFSTCVFLLCKYKCMNIYHAHAQPNYARIINTSASMISLKVFSFVFSFQRNTTRGSGENQEFLRFS